MGKARHVSKWLYTKKVLIELELALLIQNIVGSAPKRMQYTAQIHKGNTPSSYETKLDC